MTLTKRIKTAAIKKVRKHDKDTGSAGVQVSVLSKQIDKLAAHLKKNHKDNHSRKGLLQMVADRRKHLKYIEKKDVNTYTELVKTIGLKK
jgi:small subunit ribosomal protein S15